MLIARDKKQNNIAEYVLYMWQVEDMVRACGMHIDTIQAHIIDAFEASSEVKQEMRLWYESLIATMKNEQIEKQGHCKSIQSTVDDLQQFHNELIKTNEHAIYSASFYRAFPHIQALNAKTTKATGEIELCFNALYGALVLRLKKQELSKETQASIDELRSLIRQLTQLYHTASRNELELDV